MTFLRRRFRVWLFQLRCKHEMKVCEWLKNHDDSIRYTFIEWCPGCGKVVRTSAHPPTFLKTKEHFQ